MSWRLVLAACAALVLAFAIRWWLPSDRPGISVLPPPDTRFDYTLTDFSARFSDANGKVELLVSGPRLEHDSATRVATLLEPRFLLDPTGSNWHGQSRTGRFERDEEELVLEGEVILTQPLESGSLVIETERLQHHRLARTISANQTVTAQQPGTWLRAGGLMIRLDQDTIEFSNHVQVQMQVVSPDPRRPGGADGATDRRGR